MTCSVVMVSYHTGPVLFHAIERVLAQEGLARLVLVDNGNPPEVLARLHALALAQAKLVVLSGHGNVGFARGNNIGARHAEGAYLLLLNPDCLLEEGALTQFAQALETHGAMLAGGLLLNADGSEQRGGRRELLTPHAALAEGLRLDRLGARRLSRHTTPTPQTVCEVPAISGACMFMKRAEYLRLGGLDEGYFLHVEDLDFCKRVADAGGKTLFVPQVRVVHLLSTSEAPSCFVERCKARGFARYFRTHHPGAPRLLFAAIWLRYALKLAGGRLPRGMRATAIAGKKTLLLLEARTAAPMHNLHGKTVLVTGATSPLGALVLGYALGAAAQAIAVSRGAGMALSVPGLRWVRADITSAFSAPRADAAIHCAPLWALPPALEALARAGVKNLVAFGSTSVFSKEDSADARERQLATRLRTAEEEVRQGCAALGIACTLLRPTMIYGTGLDANVSRIARFIRRMHFLPVVPPACGLRQPVHADDLAQAALNALCTPTCANRSYNLSGGETLTYRVMVERIFAALGKKPRLLPLPFLPPILDAAGRLLHNSSMNASMATRMNKDLCFPHEDAARDFGYRPRAFACAGLGV